MSGMSASAIPGRRVMAVCCLASLALAAAACGSAAPTAGPATTVTVTATPAVSDVLIGNNCVHKVQVAWVQVYPPGQYSALSGRLSRPGCAGRSLVTMGVTTVTSGA
jgi:hypothetical protein